MEVNITIPTSLSEIKLKDYQRFMTVVKNQGEDMDDLFLRQKMVEIFCNIPMKVVMKIPRKEFIHISNMLVMIIKEQPELQSRVEIGGKTFGFIPDLDNGLTTGEFIDLDTYMKDWKDFHKAMAVLYRPVRLKRKDKYTIEEYESSSKYSDDMLGVSMDVVMGAILFFYRLSSVLLRITPKYLQHHLQKDKKVQVLLEQNGVGINTYISSLEETCLKLERLLSYHWALPLSGSPTTKSITPK